MLTLASLNRWKAAGIHLTASALVGALVLALMLGLWYRPPFFEAAGGSGLIVLLIGVDVVLGPLMTLIVFNPAKKNLRFDLMAIVFFQVAALIYGLTIMSLARPAYLVYTKDRFDLVAAIEIDRDSLAKAKAPFDDLPWTGPRLAGVRFPTDPVEQQKLVMGAIAGSDISQLPQYFIPYDDVEPVTAMRSHPLAQLRAKDPSAAAAIDAAVHASGRPEASLAYVPVRARTTFVALVDAKTGAFVNLLPANGW